MESSRQGASIILRIIVALVLSWCTLAASCIRNSMSVGAVGACGQTEPRDKTSPRHGHVCRQSQSPVS